MDINKLPIKRLIELAKLGQRYDELIVHYDELKKQKSFMGERLDWYITYYNANKDIPITLNTPEANKEHFTNKLYAKMHKYFSLKSKNNRESKDLENDIEILIRALKVTWKNNGI